LDFSAFVFGAMLGLSYACPLDISVDVIPGMMTQRNGRAISLLTFPHGFNLLLPWRCQLKMGVNLWAMMQWSTQM
jgi:hypothetical protein